jgi:hypothetical protein
MKEQIREILWNFVAGEVTDSEAIEQVLDLFAVVGRSEQLLAFVEFIDKDLIDNVKPSEIVERFLSQ